MKKRWTILLALCLFTLLSCGKSDTLYDILSECVAKEDLPTGRILSYGRNYENTISFDTLSDSLGLENYPEFADGIEDFALFSTLQGDYSEIMLIRLYRVGDTKEALLMLERRAADIKRALNTSGKKGSGEAEIVKKGNVVALYMLPDACGAKKAISKRL